MPIIDFTDRPGVLVALSGATSITPDLALFPRPRVRPVDGSTSLTGILGVSSPLSLTLPGITTIDAFLRLNGESNILLSATAVGSTTLTPTATRTISLSQVVQGFTTLSANTQILEADVFELNMVMDILPAGGLPGLYITDRPRLLVDDVEVPITRWTYTEGENSAGAELQVTLARLSDRDTFVPGVVINFGLGKKVSGLWDETTFLTLLAEGVYRGTTHSISWANNTPGDSVTITCGSKINEKLNKTAPTDLIIYDDLRETVDVASLEPIYDTQGRAYATDKLAITNMKLYDLFHEVFVERCGFTSYHTNLPNFPIQRLNCDFGQSYFEALRGYIGMFDPVIYEVDDALWVVDTTVALPSGFPAPRDFTVSQYKTLSSNAERARIDAMLVHYSELQAEYNYTTFRYEDTSEEVGNSVIDTHKIYIEFRKTSQPFVVVREALNDVSTTTTVNGVIVATSEENLLYNSVGNIISRRKTTYSRLPDLSLSTVGDIVYTTQLDSVEEENYAYAVHPYRPRQQYCSSKSLVITGLVAVDSDNPQFGVPYQSPYRSAWTTGNIAPGITLMSAPIRSRYETSLPLRNGMVRTKVIEINELANQLAQEYTEERVGDIGVNGMSLNQNRVLVFDADNQMRTTDRIETMHIGELPLLYGIPLVRRLLVARKTKNDKVSLEGIGFDRTLRKGSAVTAKGRGETIGTFIILSRVASGDANGITTTYTSKEI